MNIHCLSIKTTISYAFFNFECTVLCVFMWVIGLKRVFLISYIGGEVYTDTEWRRKKMYKNTNFDQQFERNMSFLIQELIKH